MLFSCGTNKNFLFVDIDYKKTRNIWPHLTPTMLNLFITNNIISVKNVPLYEAVQMSLHKISDDVSKAIKDRKLALIDAFDKL